MNRTGKTIAVGLAATTAAGFFVPVHEEHEGDEILWTAGGTEWGVSPTACALMAHVQ